MTKYLQSENCCTENRIAAFKRGFIDLSTKTLAGHPLPGLLKIQESDLQYFDRGDEAVDFEELPQDIQDQLTPTEDI